MFNSQWKKELINKGCWDLLGAALHFPSIPSFPAAGDEGKKRLPSGYLKIAIENGHLWWIFPLKVVIFHNCVSLPEGKHRKAMIQLRMTRFPVINHTLRILRTSPANSVLPNQSTGLFFIFFMCWTQPLGLPPGKVQLRLQQLLSRIRRRSRDGCLAEHLQRRWGTGGEELAAGLGFSRWET